MKLISNRPETIEILKCLIEADSTKEIAHITTNTNHLPFDEYQIVSGAKKIFTGKLNTSLDHKEYKLETVKTETKAGVLKKVLQDLECSTFMRAGSGKIMQVKSSDLMSLSIKRNQDIPFKVRLNLIWTGWQPESWDVGTEIFPTFKTMTPNSIIKAFPTIHSTLKEWFVAESSITTKNKKWYKVKDKYREVIEFNGSLLLQRVATVFNYETWELGSEEAEKCLDLFLDLTQYTCPYSNWQPNTRYKKNTLAIFQDSLKRAKVEHLSTEVFQDIYWDNEENYYYCDQENLLASNFGQDLLTALKENVHDFLLKTYPLLVIDFIGTWETWKDLEIGTTLEITTPNETIKAEVTKFTKKMYCSLEKSKREVLVQCRTTREIGSKITDVLIDHSSINRSVNIINDADTQLTQEEVKGSMITLAANPFYVNQIRVKLR